MRLSDKYPFLTNYFTKAIEEKQNAHFQSIVFYGNDIESQYILATEIARLLNCKGDLSDDCNCLNCNWINAKTHPAVLTFSRMDNKPEDDESKMVISLKQANLIKEMLLNSSEFHRVFIFCDRDDNGNVSGLNRQNFQAETANALLKTIEEPQDEITFIFLTRYIDDLLSTIISRSQCFFVPSKLNIEYNYDIIKGVFENYWEFDRASLFEVSDALQNLLKECSLPILLENIQNYILNVLKSNPRYTFLIEHIKILEDAKRQAKLGMRPVNILDDLCLKLIK